MDAKYVVATSGRVAIFSKYLGMEHIEVAGLLDAHPGDKEIAGAGFCTLVDDQIITFGRSTSLEIASAPGDAKTLTSLLLTGKLTLVFLERKLGYVATNAPEMFEHDKSIVATPQGMMSARIFK